MTLAAALLALAVSQAEVDRIHREAILIDTHNDVTMKVLKGYDLAQPAPRGSTDVAKLKAGGVDAVFFAAYVPARYARTGGAAAYCRRAIVAIHDGIVASSRRRVSNDSGTPIQKRKAPTFSDFVTGP